MQPMNDKETTDEIILETRRIKEALAESMDFDLDRILEDAREKQKKAAGLFFLLLFNRSPNDGIVPREFDWFFGHHELHPLSWADEALEGFLPC